MIWQKAKLTLPIIIALQRGTDAGGAGAQCLASKTARRGTRAIPAGWMYSNPGWRAGRLAGAGPE